MKLSHRPGDDKVAESATWIMYKINPTTACWFRPDLFSVSRVRKMDHRCENSWISSWSSERSDGICSKIDNDQENIASGWQWERYRPAGLWPPWQRWSAADRTCAAAPGRRRPPPRTAGKPSKLWGDWPDPPSGLLKTPNNLSVPSAPVWYRCRPRCWSLPDSQRPSRVLRADLSRVLQAPRLFSWRLIGDVTNNLKVWRTAWTTELGPVPLTESTARASGRGSSSVK